MVVAHRSGFSSDLYVFNIACALPGILLLIARVVLAQAFIPLYRERRTALPALSNL